MSKTPSNPKFDYGTVTNDEAGRLRCYEGELLSSRKRVANEIVRHGEILYYAQQLLANYSGGVFVSWIASVGLSKSAVYRAIDVFREFASFPNWENMEVSAAYELAKNEAAKKKAIRLADRGVKVTHSMAKQLVEESRPKGRPAPFDAPDTDGQDEESVTADADTDVSGEDDETDVAETEVVETAPEPPEEDGTEPETVPGDSYEPRELTPKEKAIATRALCKQLYGKLDRLLDDLHSLKPDLFRRDECRTLLRASEEHLW